MGYRIIKKDEDHKRSLIEKDDNIIEFTIADADARQGEYKRMETEWSAQIKVCQAMLKNIERNHPEIAKLDPVKKEAAKMWVENSDMIAAYEPKLKELRKAMKRYDKERADIYKTFNWSDDGGTTTK